MITNCLRDWRATFAVVTLAVAWHATARAADPFAENVRLTEPQTAEAQQKAFKLPPGFQMQLVASEPEIAKPMNMAFDARGRLWVTESREYPFPVPLGQTGHDSIRVFSDFDANGRAHKMTIFADGLNIPTGVLPYKNGVIAWSIPNIWYFEDTDGDGVADKRTILYGPLGWERDTHGMNSSFRRGYDGWMYATHGFNNNTTLRGRDGNTVTMNSGNVYRVQVDGSRAEQFTWGQVNPFGLTFDSLGNLYSSDCHSQPAYQLLRGGYYPSFGKPHDGLGFAPEMIFHDHGSTAIDGMSMYSDDQWPAEFRENIFTGNVMTSRVDRDRLERHGTTAIALETPDLVSTTDPWFRPVDTQLGPDGALYIADFYNRIIGHYEVPLTHPGRDRYRGRIWRLVYTGTDAMGPKRKRDNDVSKFNGDKLIAALRDPNLTYRMLAMNELVDRVASAAVRPLQKMLVDKRSAPSQRIHGMWALHRLGGLDEKSLLRLANDPDAGVRVHAMRIAAELPKLSEELHQRAVRALTDSNPLVVRCAADALSTHPDEKNVASLLALRGNVPAEDTHLLYAVRKSLRDQLNGTSYLTKASNLRLSASDSKALADVAVAVPTSEAGTFLLRHIEANPEDRATLANYLRHSSRYAPALEMGSLARLVRNRFSDDTDFQLTLFKSVQQGFEQRGAAVTGEVATWGEALARALLADARSNSNAWFNTPFDSSRPTASPWILQKRRSADRDTDAVFLSSLPPGGEALTGVLRSGTFAVPPKLTFYMAGHDGPPQRPPQKKNLVRLRDASNGEVLAEAAPPRNDVAQLFSWDLSAYTGRTGAIEIVDGDTGNAYAWLAVGRFSPAIVSMPTVDPNRAGQRLQAGAELARALSLKTLRTELVALVKNPSTDLEARATSAQTIVSWAPDPGRSGLAALIADPSIPSNRREQIAALITDNGNTSSESENLVLDAFKTLPHRSQVKLAQGLAASGAGAEQLIFLVSTGKAPANLLLERSIKDKLFAVLPKSLTNQITELTARLPTANQAIQKVIDARRAGYESAKPSVAQGQEIFTRNCRVCHQLEGNGALVGPQLDGIGNRGLERVLEDVLDPNRAVDPAFRGTIFTLTDGDVTSGLFRREEGERIIIADSTGKEIPLAKNQIKERRESQTSLMPDNFGEVIPEKDFYDLVAFLLSKRGKVQ